MDEKIFNEAVEYLSEGKSLTTLDLNNYLEKTILPKYNHKNVDDAHKENHIMDVLNKAMKIADDLNLSDREKEIVRAAAILHDIGLLKGDRERHNINSAEFVKNDKFLKKYFTEAEIEEIAKAVEDHRASLKYEPRSIYGKIISTADRNLDIINILERCIQYRLKRGMNDYQNIYDNTYDHFKEKYSRNGYMRLPIKTKSVEKELEKMYSYENPTKFKKAFDTAYKNLRLTESIEYLFESQELNESLEMLVARPGTFFKKNITLYRADRNPEFDGVVYRTFLNGGTNISGPRASSFWSDDKMVILHYLTRGPIGAISKIEDIENFPEEIKEYYKEKKTKKRVTNDLNDNHWIIFYRNEKEKNKIQKILEKSELRDYNGNIGIFVHELDIKGNDPDLGIGHNPMLREFTLDRDVVPTRTQKYTKVPKEALDEIEWTNDPVYFVKRLKREDEHSEVVTKWEKFIKHHYNPKKPEKTGLANPDSVYKTDFFKNEFIKYINSGKTNFCIISDAHIGHNINSYRDVLNQAHDFGVKLKEIKNIDYLLILGDFIDKKWTERFEEIFKTFKSPMTRDEFPKILYILGNGEHEQSPLGILKKTYELKKGLMWSGYKIETDKYVFTHAPINVKEDQINIHGHLHGSQKYWNADPQKCINVSSKKGEFLSFDDVLKIGVSKNGIKLDSDPTGGKKNKVMTKLYKKYDLKETIDYLLESQNELTTKIIKQTYNGQDGFHITFFDGKKEIGECSVCDDYYGSKLSFLYGLEVKKEFRGQGYGTKIVQYMIDKYNVKYLNVAKDNEIAKKLYKKFGFKRVGNVRMDNGEIMDRMERKESLKEATDYLEENFESIFRGKNIFKKITLYHVSRNKKDIIKPEFLHYGTKLSKPRFSSFWFDKPESCLVYYTAMLPVLSKLGGKDYEECFKKANKTDWEEWKKNVVKRYDLQKVFVNKEYCPALKNNALSNIVYLYKYETPIYKTGLGWLNSDEYTIDYEVKPDGVDICKGSDLLKYIEFVDAEIVKKMNDEKPKDELKFPHYKDKKEVQKKLYKYAAEKNLLESQKSILEKAHDIMDKMKDIQYGSVYSNGRIITGGKDENAWYYDSNKFCPQPVQSILKTKVGHCIDQSELERYYFKQAGIKHKVFSMFPARGTNRYNNHTFLVFFDENDTPYWFDHSWYSERGIHKGESLEELFKKICDKKRKTDPHNEKEKEIFKNIKYEIFEVPAKERLSWNEYIDWVWRQKLVYKG